MGGRRKKQCTYCGSYRTQEGRIIDLYRSGQKCKFSDRETQEQVGPEQSNLAPAVAAAISAGWKIIS